MNLFKTLKIAHLSPSKALENFLVKYFNYPSSMYLRQVLSEWQKLIVRKTIELVFNGIMFFIALYWVYFLIGIEFTKIQVVLHIISLGFSSLLIRGSYKYFKQGWRYENEQRKKI